MILGNPTALDRRPQHIEAIMNAASKANRTGWWSIPDPGHPVVQTHATAASAGSGLLWQGKMAAAGAAHAAAPELDSPVAGRRVLLVDDVFTTGAQMVTLARRHHIALEDHGLVLAGAPW